MQLTFFLPHSGVVFPYQTPLGRYNMNFTTAVQTCLDQDAMIATQDQLFKAWKGGLDCCNAGWLSDGTVRYAVTKPRETCGGLNNRPGLRNYGLADKQSLYDVFCYASALKGKFYLNIFWCLNSSSNKNFVILIVSVAFSAVRTFLLAGSILNANLWWGCAGMFGWWCRDCQGGPHLCSLEAWRLRSLWSWLVGWWKCPLPDHQASQKLQPHGSCSAICWIPRQNTEVLRRLLLQGRVVSMCKRGKVITTKQQ